ncbi:hypothetical protein KPH14_001094 [Odynerus spinipes]|uniref:Uncharacterized protein n=1 Tax=Odynerus spinipes TaxID=1348599 RepID=A0AAD9RDP1_9HYME|nr:hypothetical protein KPH14_001094 [Odynerus spinipes]
MIAETVRRGRGGGGGGNERTTCWTTPIVECPAVRRSRGSGRIEGNIPVAVEKRQVLVAEVKKSSPCKHVGIHREEQGLRTSKGRLPFLLIKRVQGWLGGD